MKYCLLCVLGGVLQFSPLPSSAQMYKWTDAQGKIHYTDRAGDASAGRAAEIKVPPPPSVEAQSLRAKGWRDAEAAYQERHRPGSVVAKRGLPVHVSTGRGGQGYQLETPRAKCGLAQDILSGEAVHVNRKPVDKYDRKIAASDVKAFCR